MLRRHRLLLRLLPQRVGGAISFMKEAEEAYETAPRREVPSLARDLVIATIDPVTGKIWNNARYAVPTAVLLELVHEGRLDVTVTGRKRKVHLALREATPLGNAELDEAMLTIGAGMLGRRLTVLLSSMPETSHILRPLIEEGLVVEETHRRLGVTTRRYRTTPSSGREEIVARIRSALLGESIPDDRTALLISSLVDVHSKVFVDKKQVREAGRRRTEVLDRIGEDERAIVHAVVEHISNQNG